MIEILKKYGFDFKGSCSCDGVYAEKYRNGDYEIRYRPKRMKFRIKKYGNSITNWLPVSEIENTLKKYVQAIQEEA